MLTLRALAPLVLVLAALAAPAAAAAPDPASCAALALHPALGPRAWENATEWRAWTANASLWGLRGAGGNAILLAHAAGHARNATRDPVGATAHLAEEDLAGFPAGPGAPPALPAAGLSGKLVLAADALGHAGRATPSVVACADAATGATGALDAATRESGRVVAAFVRAASPYAEDALAAARDAECAAWRALGADVCADGEDRA